MTPLLPLRVTLPLLLLCLAPAAHAQATPGSGAPATPPPEVQKNKPAPIARTESNPPGSKVWGITGTLLLTPNASTLGRPAPSVNQKLTLDYTLPHSQVLDLRVENYYEGSYNRDPPGQLLHNINEQKLELQATYTYPLTRVFSLSAALLHHDNFTITDTYYWGIGTLTAKLPLSKALTFTTNISAEKRLSGGRLFADSASTLDYVFVPNWTFETNYHRYENYGQKDLVPTEKEESEFGVIRQLPGNKTVGLSFFRHTQHGSPNDQFSFIHLKYGIGF